MRKHLLLLSVLVTGCYQGVDLSGQCHAAYCESQEGVCRESRKTPDLCVNGQWMPCTDATYLAQASLYQPGREASCDGLDNDCDGSTDEDFAARTPDEAELAGVGKACGTGACLGGISVCTPDSTGVECSTTGLAKDEVCNGSDDDCDGMVDEGFDVGKACGIGNCSDGRMECGSDGLESRCDTMPGGSKVRVAPDICDGQDNDCDGLVDGDDPDLQACDTGPFCSPNWFCSAGSCLGTGSRDCSIAITDLQCQKSGCDETQRICIAINLPDEITPCDDGNAATYDDHCLNGLCLGLPCPCLVRAPADATCCDGCHLRNEALNCDDGNSSTYGDSCHAGACRGNPCPCRQEGTCCDGCHPLAEGATCDDGESQTYADRCIQGACTGTPCGDCGLGRECSVEGCTPVRFQDLGAGFTADWQEGLVWSRGTIDATWSVSGSIEACRTHWNSAVIPKLGLALENWHLPTIDELRTAVLGCSDTAPGGSCKVHHGSGIADQGSSCLDPCPTQDCWTEPCYGGGGFDRISSSLVADAPAEYWTILEAFSPYGRPAIKRATEHYGAVRTCVAPAPTVELP